MIYIFLIDFFDTVLHYLSKRELSNLIYKYNNKVYFTLVSTIILLIFNVSYRSAVLRMKILTNL